MKRFLYSALTSAFLIGLMTGCASVETAKVNFVTPGNDGIAFAPGSKIRLVSNGNERMCDALKRILAHEFQAVAEKNVQNAVALAQSQGEDTQKAKAKAEAEQIQITDANPDYWLFVSIQNEYRKDTANVTEYNRVAMRSKIESDAGGRENVKSSGALLSGAVAAVANMTLYSVHGLVPIHSFDITIYDSEVTKETLKDEGQYLKKFVHESVKRIKDGFLTMEREMTILYPPNADKKLVTALKANDGNMMQAVAESLNLSPLDKFLEEIKALEEQNNPKQFSDSKMVEKMANHYVYAVDFESRNLNTRSLRLVHRCYLAMLRNTDDKLLVEACANSLARVEKKLEMLESVKQ